MRDLFLIAFVVALIGTGFKRPFLFVLAYAYIDIVAPQRVSYYLLNSIPISLITFCLAFVGFFLADSKEGSRFSPRQGIMALLLLYCGYTTTTADFPVEAMEKWSWVWKAMVFAIFLPLTLRTRLRIEALALVMVLSAASLIITGGIKTLASGGGYGALTFLISDNYGLYEGSTLSTVAISIIPLIWWLSRNSTVFPPDWPNGWMVKAFCWALIFACLLIPVGSQARTGLVCIGVLAVLILRTSRHRFVIAGAMALAVTIAIPFLPQSFTERMSTMQDHKADQSASTRLAVWAWTWDYVKDHPGGGGFDAFRGNKLVIEKVDTEESGSGVSVDTQEIHDAARAYHSSYFEMLGEQGYFGFLLWLAIHATGIVRMELLQRRFRKSTLADDQWIASLAAALQNGQIIYMVGALFVGIAFQPFVYMLVALQIALDSWVVMRDQRRAAAERQERNDQRKMARRRQRQALRAEPLPE